MAAKTPGWFCRATGLAALGLAVLTGCHSAGAPAASHSAGPVAVPARAVTASVDEAYAILHQRGFRVDLTRQLDLRSMNAQLVSISPPPGTQLPYGSTVRITPSTVALGSAVSGNADSQLRVPDFSGRTLTDAVDFAGQHDMFWAVPALPAQNGIDTMHLFDAYRVTRQTPKPGETIIPGVTPTPGGLPSTLLTLTVVPVG